MAEINKKDPTSAGQSGNVNNESYTFRCADVGFSDCQWKTSGRSQDEVLRNAEQHGREQHNLSSIDDNMRDKVRSKIQRAA